MKKYIKYVFTILVIMILGILYSCEKENSDVKLMDSDEVSSVVTSEEVTYTTGHVEDSTRDCICIHVTGCVANPGVYQLPKGSRVYEAIVLAGGFAEEADREFLNQAALLSDGQKLHVYSKEETVTARQDYGDGGVQQSESKLVNINTASKEELMTLPGIGESRADSIIAYREDNGGFKSIQDIMKVSGIKDAAFEKIKDYICTN